MEAMEKLGKLYKCCICRTHLQARINEIKANNSEKKTSEEIAGKNENSERSTDYIDSSLSSNIHETDPFFDKVTNNFFLTLYLYYTRQRNENKKRLQLEKELNNNGLQC